MIFAFWEKLTKQERLIAYVALVVFLLAFFDRFMLEAILSRMDTVESEIRMKELLVKKNLKLLHQKDVITNEDTRYSVYSIQAKSPEEEISGVLKEIERLASESSVVMSEIKPTGIEEGAVVKKYSIALSCEATMEQLANFMFQIENSKILFTIDTYSLSSKDREKGIVKCTMSVSKIVIP